MADVHKLGKNSKNKVEEMIDITGLGPEQNKKIGALSKGYRQRTGLAQALIHDPEVLILDEPTSGLDPNQLKEIRNLIIKTGQKKTIILSTHIMQEVEAVCNRAIIINKGKIIADALTSELQIMNQAEKIIIVEFDIEVPEDDIKKIEGVKEVTKVNDNSYRIFSESGEDIRSKVFDFAVEKNRVILSIKLEEQSLENVFRSLTSNIVKEDVDKMEENLNTENTAFSIRLNLYISNSNSISLMVKNEFNKMSLENQEEFVDEFKRRKKSLFWAYMFLLFIFHMHYGYLNKWGLQIVYWLTGGGFLIWWFIDWFRLPSLVRNYNKDIATDIMKNIKAISAK